MQICKPAYVRSFSGDSVVYNYDATNRLTSISYFDHYSPNVQFQDNLELDVAGNVIGLQKIFVPSGRVDQSFKLSYSAGKPDTLKTWSGPSNSEFYSFTAFKYDDKGRLIERHSGSSMTASISNRYRYEYNEDGNVSKTFFTFMDNPEFLGWENTSFDKYPRFFSGSKELETVNIFMYNYDPSINNKLTATYNAANPQLTFSEPVDVAFTATYNGQLIESHAFPFHQIDYVPDFAVLKAGYNCK